MARARGAEVQYALYEFPWHTYLFVAVGISEEGIILALEKWYRDAFHHVDSCFLAEAVFCLVSEYFLYSDGNHVLVCECQPVSETLCLILHRGLPLVADPPRQL